MKTVDLSQLPLADLVRYLQDNLLPEADQFLLPQSVGPSSLSAETKALVSTGTVPARAYRNAAFNLVPGWQKIPIDTASFDPASHMDVVTNHRYNVPAAGYYQVNATVGATLQNNPQQFGVAVYKNNVVQAQNVPTWRGGVGGDGLSAAVADVIQCAAADYLELWGYNIGANNMALITALSLNYLSVVRVA